MDKKLKLKSTVAVVHATIAAHLSMEDVDDIMNSALDAIGYWCSKATVDGEYLGKYASEQIARGGKLLLHDAEGVADYELDLGKFTQGFRIWLERGGDLYGAVSCDGNVDPGNIDGDCADSIIQYAIFGEIVYS